MYNLVVGLKLIMLISSVLHVIIHNMGQFTPWNIRIQWLMQSTSDFQHFVQHHFSM